MLTRCRAQGGGRSTENGARHDVLRVSFGGKQSFPSQIANPAVNDASRSPVLDEIVRRVIEVAQPDRIILFGSAARGQMGPDSDIDLLGNPRAVAHTSAT